MKNFIRYFLLTVIINSSLFSQGLFTQAENTSKLPPVTDFYEKVFQTAENLRLSGALPQAITEYKRYIFLQDYSKGIHLTQSYKALSSYYKEQKNYELSVAYFRLALNSDTKENLIPNQLELIELMELDANAKNQSVEQNPLFFSYLWLNEPDNQVKQAAWNSLLHNMIYLKDWNHLESTFDAAVTQFPSMFTSEEQINFTKNLNLINTFKPKNQMLAAHLSFIPGLGQLYAKDYSDALNAFLLNGSLITLGVYSLCTHNYLDFSLLELEVILHFYKGNIYNAQRDTYQYNQKQISTYQRNLLEITRQK